MRELYFSERTAWREWLAQNHDRDVGGIWLVFYRKATGQPTLDYAAAVEEALCFGWIDSIIKKLDDERYVRKFTPRKLDSAWSAANKERVGRLIPAGRMTEAGMARVEAAKRSGAWRVDPGPDVAVEMPPDLAAALAENRQAREFFDRLPPNERRNFIAWNAVAKRSETRRRRLAETLERLAAGRRLGMK